MTIRKEEITRKLLHVVFGAVIPAGILYIPLWVRARSLPFSSNAWLYPTALLALSSLFFLVVEYARFRVTFIRNLFQAVAGSMLREEEGHKATGATYIALSSFLCSLLFYRRPDIAAMVIGMFIWGDAVAAIAGQTLGRIKIGKKSLEGSLACFLLCLILLLGVFPHVPLILDPWGGDIGVVAAVLIALAITIQELFPIRIGSLTINDNLSVPLFTGIFMLLLQRFSLA